MSLSGGQHFSKLDLSQAYLQVPVSEDSRKYLTITTHKGMFSIGYLSGLRLHPQFSRRS